MMSPSSGMVLDLDEPQKTYTITGDVTRVTGNARMMFSLKRLGVRTLSSGGLEIPYDEGSKEKRLKELQDLAERFEIDLTYSPSMNEAVGHFIRQRESFAEFANRARSIRNDDFKDDEVLLKEFREFTSVVSKEVIRTLYPLQLLSAYHMAFAQNSCNFAVPGAGKTTIVYAAYAYLKCISDEAKHVDKIMVIGPTAAFDPWEDEYEACFGRRPSSIRLSELNHTGRSSHLYSGHPAELTIISFGMLDRYAEDIGEFLKRNRTLLIVDEAHYVKSFEGVWSNAVLRFADKAVARVALTGTPAPNGYEDIYNLYRFIWPHKYDSIIGMNYASLKGLAKDIRHKEKATQLSERISPFFIRIKKSDLHLPPAVEHKPLLVDMSESQKKIYEFIEAKYVDEFGYKSTDGLKGALMKAKLIRLRQAATNPALLNKPLDEYYKELGYSDSLGIDDSDILDSISKYASTDIPPKFRAVKDLIERITSTDNEKVLIWSSFVKNSKDLKEYLEASGHKTELLIGEIEHLQRRDVIKKFNDPANHEFKVVIANPRAVGESISLHKGCHNAVYLDMDYNAASFVQSKDRIHRVGLPENTLTNYYYLVTKDTVDGVIMDRVNEKVEAMNRLINADIPLFVNNGVDTGDGDASDLIRALISDYSRRNSK